MDGTVCEYTIKDIQDKTINELIDSGKRFTIISVEDIKEDIEDCEDGND